MRKKHLAFFLALILTCTVLSIPASANGAVLRIRPPDSYPKVGERFEVTIELEGNPGFNVFQLILAFDTSAMRCTAIEVGPMLQEMQYDYNPERKEGLSIAAISLTSVTGDGVIAVCSFEALQDLESWDFSIADKGIGDEDGADLPLTVVLAHAPDAASAPSESPVSGTPPEKDADTPSPEETPQAGEQANPGTPPGPPASSETDEAAANPPASSETEKGPATPEEILPGGAPAEPEEDIAYLFSDTAGHWGEKYISEAVRRGMFKGYSDDLFGPNDPVTRGQFVTVLYRLAGKPHTDAAVTFDDISDQLPEFQEAIVWAAAQGYVSGRSAAVFDPKGNITRQEAMKILFAYSGGMSGMEAMLAGVYDAEYTDSAAIASWAKSAMYWGVYNQIISGTGDKTLSPEGTATRAQLAKMLVSYVNM